MPVDSDGWYVFPPDGGKLKLEVDLGAGWVNLTPWWAGLQRVSGRAGPLDRFNASTLSFQLDNRDREWCPWRTGPHGKPGRNKPVRLRAATPGGLIVPRFAGWTTKWEEAVQVGVQGVGVTRAIVECTDGFRRLARANGIATTPAGAGELSGNRVQRILDAADWDAGLRAIDDGEVTLAATDLSRPALDELQDVALSEGGVLFIDVYGRVTFFDRDTMDGVFPPEAVLGGSIPTGDKRFAEDDSALVNTVRVARTGGTASTAVDATSVAADGQRLWTRTDLPLETDGQATTLAAVLLSRAINSVFLPGPLRLEPMSGGADVWDAVVRLQVTNPIAVVHTDQELGSGFTASTRIDGITDDIQPGRWVTTYTHSPLDEPGSYTVVTSITDLACTSTGSSITWTWNIPVHGYDRLWLRLDGGDWFEVSNTLESVTVSGLSPSSSHTLCVRGRLDLIDADQVCGTCTTLAVPGPPDPDPPPGEGDPGDIPLPPADPDCVDEEWFWTFYELDMVGLSGWVEIDSGGPVIPELVASWWSPEWDATTPGNWYRLCWQKFCNGLEEGDEECNEWLEPLVDWSDPCDFPDPTVPDPDPVFWVEACGATGAMRELVSDSVFFPREMFDGVSPDPNNAVAIQVGNGINPGVIGAGYYAQIGELGTFQVVDTAMTVGMWVNFDSEPNVLYPMVRVGTTGDDAIGWALYARGSSLSVGKVKITLSVMTASGPYEIDWDTVGEDDTVPIAGWHTVVVTWGDHDVDGDIARLYIDAVQVGADEALPADWWVKDHDTLLEWRGEPNSETAHLMGWDVILTQAQIDELFTPEVTPPLGTLAEEILVDGPRHFWKIDETVGPIEDYGSPTDVDGTVPAAPAAPALATIALPVAVGGSAPDFDGSDDRIDLGDDSSLTYTGHLVIEALIRPDVAGTNAVITKSNAQSANNSEWALFFNSGALTFVIYNTGSGTAWKSVVLNNHRVRLGEWNHIVAHYNNDTGEIALWMNRVKLRWEVPVASGTRAPDNGIIAVIGANRAIGAYRHWWNGSLAYIAQYDNLNLVDARIQAHFDTTGLTALTYSTFESVLLEDNPVFYAPLDETTGTAAKEISINGGDAIGTYVGSPTLAARALPAAIGGSAPDFDGTNDTAMFGDVNELDFTGDFTLGMLVWCDDTSGGSKFWFSKSNQGVSGGAVWGTYTNTSQLRFIVYTTGTPIAHQEKIVTAPSTGAWHHVMFRYNNTTKAMAIFIDGVKDETTPTVTGTRNTSCGAQVGIGSSMGAGAGNGSPRLYHNGNLAHVVAYDTALSDARCAAHFAATGL